MAIARTNTRYWHLQTARTLQIGAAAGRKGTAEYRLRLTGGKVADAAGPTETSKVEKIAGGEALVRTLDLKEWWPAGSDATLIRRAILNCHQSVCEVVLLPL